MKKRYAERSYRKRVNAQGLVSFEVIIKETDLWVSAGKDLEKETQDLVLQARHQIETYIRTHPVFLTTLKPYPEDPLAPPLVREMISATRPSGVGPMASVAGAIAEFVGRGLLNSTDQVIVENGGDIFLMANRPVTVSIFAGDSPLSEKLGLRIPARQMPLGVCTSSGTIGHSLSLGAADAACVLSASTALADGAATALGNRIQGKGDLAGIEEWAASIPGVLGCLVILGDRMTAWGDIELTEL
ncbi:MAG: UPF0280 family protein [Thermodesulfobacteriota bacterium]